MNMHKQIVVGALLLVAALTGAEAIAAACVLVAAGGVLVGRRISPRLSTILSTRRKAQSRRWQTSSSI